MMSIERRKEEYENLKKQKAEEKKRIKNNKAELANLVASFDVKEAVIYINEKNAKALVIIKDCENCHPENIGILGNFLPDLKCGPVAKRSSPDMAKFSGNEIKSILAFIADDNTKILKILSLCTMGEEHRWRAEIYNLHIPTVNFE